MQISTSTYSPGILSLLPLFYVGWSDSVLSPTEMKMIHKKILALDFLTEEDKVYLINHTNPQNPPSEELFKEWLDAIRNASQNLPASDKMSLAQMGVEMAQTSITYKNNQLWESPQVFEALADIEKELGVNTLEDLQSLGHHLDEDIRSQIKPRESSFDPNEMKNILWGNYNKIKEKTTKLLRDPVFVYEPIQDKEKHRQKVLELIQELSVQGYGAMAYDKRYGGQEDMGAYMAIFEIMAQHDLSLTVKFGVQFGLFGGAVSLLGTEKHHKKYVESIGRGELLGCFAMTETGHGSNVKSLETTLTYDDKSKEIIVHSPSYESGKEYIGNALHGTMAAVFGQLIVNGINHGIHAVLVPMRDYNHYLFEGVKVADCGYKIGLNGIDNGRIWFDNVRVPVDNLLDKYGGINELGEYQSPITNENRRFFTMLGALVAGRICVGAGALSAGKVALDIAIRYALRRRQFGPEETQEQLIMDYPIHQARLVPLLVKTYVYHVALDNLRTAFITAQSEDDRRKIETKAAGMKAKATWLSMETIQECREACGGKGYLSENRFGELKADADIFTTFEGDNTVLMQLVAKGLLTEFKQSFHDDGARAVIRYIFGKVSFVLAELNPYQSRNTSLDHLMGDDFQSEALRYREKKVLISLSERMRDYLKKRVNPYDAFLKCQNHMIYLAHAYVDRLVYREMGKKLALLKDSPSKTMLESLTKYYALYNIYENRDWYLENGYFEGSKTKAIRRVLNKMNQELRPELLALVDGFGISDESRRAEICGFNIKN
jgi:acyl-CoA oxidase